MSITSTIEKNEKEIRKIITDKAMSKEFERTAELYYNLSDIAKRAETIKTDIDKTIIENVKSYFSDADRTIQKALSVGDLLVKVGKDSTRRTTSYNTENVIKELKKAIPKLSGVIEDIYKKHLELSKTPTSPKLYVFKRNEQDKFDSIINGNMNESTVSSNIIKKLITTFKVNLLSHLKKFVKEKAAVVDDIVSSMNMLTESKKYYTGLDAKTKEKREKHFNKYKNKPDNDKDSYKPAPGDADSETKPSKHTKSYKDKFGQEITESIESVKKKSKETGISYSILKQVYDRGMAAWKSGHRPGTTPHQWALARINSFATGGKTRYTADKDLWDKHKSKKNIKESTMTDNNERSTMLENIKTKKNEVSACLSEGVEHDKLHDLLEEYVAASDIASTATAMRSEIAESIKEEVINLFDVEDAILNKFLEVGDYIIVVCREGERVNNKKALEGFVEELSQTIPDYVDVIENIMKTNQDITQVDVKPRTSVKSLDESIVESISSKIEKFMSYVKGLTRVFSKYLPRLSDHNNNLRAKIDMLYEETIMSESIKGDHYCIIQPNFAIFGVGRTEEEAWNSAEEWADTTDENWKQSFEVKPCTKQVFDYVNKSGTPDDWELSNGVVALPHELVEAKEKIEESKKY